jgi:hypothetical protein
LGLQGLLSREKVQRPGDIQEAQATEQEARTEAEEMDGVLACQNPPLPISNLSKLSLQTILDRRATEKKRCTLPALTSPLLRSASRSEG